MIGAGTRLLLGVERGSFAVWRDRVGQTYPFNVLTRLADAPRLPGVYILVNRGNRLDRVPLYIGETENLHRRLCVDDHPKRDLAISDGADELHIWVEPAVGLNRFQLERLLIRNYSPPHNQEHLLAMAFGGKL